MSPVFLFAIFKLNVVKYNNHFVFFRFIWRPNVEITLNITRKHSYSILFVFLFAVSLQ